jgi:hypothetical protein
MCMYIVVVIVILKCAYKRGVYIDYSEVVACLCILIKLHFKSKQLVYTRRDMYLGKYLGSVTHSDMTEAQKRQMQPSGETQDQDEGRRKYMS